MYTRAGVATNIRYISTICLVESLAKDKNIVHISSHTGWQDFGVREPVRYFA